jgi:RNA polymerase sigma factor (sigma-70 family)
MTEIAASSPAPGSSRSAGSVGISRLLPDDLLVGRATKGDRRAFEEIFQRYHQDLYRFCLAMVGNPQDAQDALQETMVKVLRALPGEKRHIQLKPWLYRIARNESVETMRRRHDSVEIEPELTASTVELAETAEDRERLRKLFADLEELPDRQRAALVMRELAGLRFAQIGAAFDTSAAVARQTVYEARLSLRQMEAGREMSCEAVTRELSDGDGRITRRREVRAHLRSCPSCRAFRDGMTERHRDLAAIAPLPLALSAGLLHGVFGSQASAAAGGLGGAAGAGGGAAVGASGSGIAGTVGAGAGKAIATSAIFKSAAAIAVAAVVGASAADRSGLIDLPLPGGGDKAAESGTRPPGAATSTPQRGSAPGASARAGDRQDSEGLGKRNPESTARAGRHGRSRSAAAAQHPVRPHRHHASQAERHGKPAGLPAASSHGQQAAAAHKPPQANASPGGGGHTGGKSAPKVTPPPSQPSPPAEGEGAATPPASSQVESPGPGKSGGGAHGASGNETLEP